MTTSQPATHRNSAATSLTATTEWPASNGQAGKAAHAWPGHISPGQTDHMIANYDFMTTLAEIVGEESPDWKDGESFLPTLLGNDPPHAPVIFSSRLGPALTTAEGWKLRHISTTDGFQLYNVLDDYREETNLASEYPDKVDQLGRQLLMACDGNFAYGNPDMHRAYYVHNHHACQDIKK